MEAKSNMKKTSQSDGAAVHTDASLIKIEARVEKCRPDGSLKSYAGGAGGEGGCAVTPCWGHSTFDVIAVKGVFRKEVDD